MGSLLSRGGRLYAKTKTVDGAWVRMRTEFVDGQEAQAERWLADLERKVETQRAALTAVNGGTMPLTVESYGEAWLDRRTTATVADDRARLRLHVFPAIGKMLLVDVRPRHGRELVMGLRNAGELAPATIRKVSGVLHAMFEGAVIDELLEHNPIKMRGVLPKNVDKDPTWRHEAIYTRAEIEQLIADEQILPDRRVLYALKALAALRHGEAAALTWAQYDHRAEPLGAINLGETKAGVPRRVPVHPELARILIAWKASGWRALYGRDPKPEDLVVPTRRFAERDANEAQRQLVADLQLLELRWRAGVSRKRRGHDMRRTFITLARTDGAIDSLLRWVTHGPSSKEMLDVYSSPPWDALCAEVAKLRISPREGMVIEMPIAAAANGGDPPADLGPDLVQTRKTGATGGFDGAGERPRRDSKACPSDRDDTRRARSPQALRIVSSIDDARGDTPSGTEIERLDQALVQDIAEQLELAAARWRSDRDDRALRRALLRALEDLEK